MSTNERFVFHLLPNAHLDPVWLWDWREGLNEALTTTKTMLDLMDEIPDLTFIRGEATLYKHIEENDSSTFQRLSQRISEGRWDIVGGTMIQPDTNLSSAETLLRHFMSGQRYFMSRFGKKAKIAWAADSFGHSAGLPEILAASGIEGFAFSRPDKNVMPLKLPAFWWEAESGAKILSYRMLSEWYGLNRDEMFMRLDSTLADAASGPLKNVGVFMGLGNHGGGPTRRHIREMREWSSRHPEVKVVFSTLHELFNAIRKELSERKSLSLPVVKGELNFCLRGCYVSMARFKFPYRRAEAQVSRAEKISATVQTLLNSEKKDMSQAWDGILFNAFHDILPGTSIERAFQEQLDWLGGAVHNARRVEFEALNGLAAKLDSSVSQTPDEDHPSPVPVLVFNPHPYEYRGPLELEVSLDYRPIFKYTGKVDKLPVELLSPSRKPIPFQSIATEHSFMLNIPWRTRVLFNAVLPPLGWAVYQIGWVENPKSAKAPKPWTSATNNSVANEFYRVVAKKGDAGIRIFKNGKNIFDGKFLSFVTVSDIMGSWGSFTENPDPSDIPEIIHSWHIMSVKPLENGPLRSSLWVRLEGGASSLELTFSLSNGRKAIDVSARLFWNERSACLKMIIPSGDKAEFEVPGGRVFRGNLKEVPGGRWVRIFGKNGVIGFASDSLYGFDCRKGETGVSIVRASRYAAYDKKERTEEPWLHATDQGEHFFKFLLSDGSPELARMSECLEMPPVSLTIPPKKGNLSKSGSILEISPPGVRLLAFKPDEEKKAFIMRLQALSQRTGSIQVKIMGEKIKIQGIKPFEISTWRLSLKNSRWIVERTDSTEK